MHRDSHAGLEKEAREERGQQAALYGSLSLSPSPDDRGRDWADTTGSLIREERPRAACHFQPHPRDSAG